MTNQSNDLALNADRTGWLDHMDDKVRYCQLIAESDIVPPAYRGKPANVLIAIETAGQLGDAPFTVMQEMSIISGRPTLSAKYVRSLVRRAGHRLRESFTDGVATCTIIRADDPEFEHTATWDKAKAVQHGLWGKGHWAKNPELMLRNRALTECAREACFEVMAGIGYTPDEVADFAPTGRPSSVPATEPRPQVPQRDYRELADAMRQAGVSSTDMPELASDLLGRTITGANDMNAQELHEVAEGLKAAAQALDAQQQAEATPEPEDGQVDEATGEIIDDKKNTKSEGAQE